MAIDAAEARRIDRPGWLNGRTVLGATLFISALLLGQQTMRSAQTTVPAWAAARDLPVETVLQPEHLRLVDVRLPDDVAPGYALGTTELVGAVLNRPLAAGELVPLRGVGMSGAGPGRVITIPVAMEHGVGGALSPGDRVDVFATFDPGASGAQTVVVAGAVEVVDVLSGGALVMSDPMMTGVSVAVDAETAAELAFAIQAGAVDLARVTKPGVSGPTSPVSLQDLAR